MTRLNQFTRIPSPQRIKMGANTKIMHVYKVGDLEIALVKPSQMVTGAFSIYAATPQTEVLDRYFTRFFPADQVDISAVRLTKVLDHFRAQGKWHPIYEVKSKRGDSLHAVKQVLADFERKLAEMETTPPTDFPRITEFTHEKVVKPPAPITVNQTQLGQVVQNDVLTHLESVITSKMRGHGYTPQNPLTMELLQIVRETVQQHSGQQI